MIPASQPWNPLDPVHIGESLRRELESREPLTLPPPPFNGAGLYALYYRGDLDLYARLSAEAPLAPVYVGKAEAGNSSYGQVPDYAKPKLYKRIEKHMKSIQEVENWGGNLRVADFRVRYLTLEDAWIVLGERSLLRAYRPVLWNTLMNGFGSNDPGTARTNPRSAWDSLHTGRPRAGSWPNRGFTREELLTWVCQGIEVLLLPEGADRDAGLARLKAARPRVIWAPPGKGPGRRLPLVASGSATRFRCEAERLGLSLTENVDYVLSDADMDELDFELPDDGEVADPAVAGVE